MSLGGSPERACGIEPRDPLVARDEPGARLARGCVDQAIGGITGELVVKQRSRERTFQRDTSDWQTVAKVLASLSHDVADELREDGLRARTIGITSGRVTL